MFYISVLPKKKGGGVKEVFMTVLAAQNIEQM